MHNDLGFNLKVADSPQLQSETRHINNALSWPRTEELLQFGNALHVAPSSFIWTCFEEEDTLKKAHRSSHSEKAMVGEPYADRMAMVLCNCFTEAESCE